MSRRVLMVLTSHGDLGGVRPTGFYVPEAAHPWRVFRAAGWGVDLVSPKGGEPPRDGLDESDPVQKEFLADPEIARQLADTRRPDQVDAGAYAAIFYVGGHGAMWDLPDDAGVARIARDIYERGGVVAAVCHGPAGLVNLTLSDGAYLVAGRRVAAFTNAEEEAVGLASVVPFLLQTRLEERGATHVAAPNFEPCVVVDGRLVTGQNPASATGVAERVVEVVDATNPA